MISTTLLTIIYIYIGIYVYIGIYIYKSFFSWLYNYRPPLSYISMSHKQKDTHIWISKNTKTQNRGIQQTQTIKHKTLIKVKQTYKNRGIQKQPSNYKLGIYKTHAYKDPQITTIHKTLITKIINPNYKLEACIVTKKERWDRDRECNLRLTPN